MDEIIHNILNEEFFANTEPQQAWWWLIPAGGGLIALLAGIFGGGDDSEPTNQTPPKSIVILGQKESGKTTLFNWLRYNKFVPGYSQTSTDEYDEFEYKGQKIAKGQDIGGGEMFFYDYENKIAGCDICVFVFDLHKFLNDQYYRQETWVRADFINRKCCEKNKTRYTIGTHLDLTSFQNDYDGARARVLDVSAHKTKFIDVFKSNFVVADLTNQTGFETCVKHFLKK